MSATKRPNYFRSQFLLVRDFQDEQSYHEELRRRHNRLMHEWGVTRDGLQVTKSGDNFSISAGSAIDNLGREIILEESHTLSAAEVQAARQTAGAGTDVFVTIAFQEVNSTEADDKYPPPGGSENVTRMVQSPIIVATKSPASDGTVIVLARIAGADGAVTNSVRRIASSFIARGSNLGDISLDGALSFTSKTSPNPTYPQMGLDYDLAGDQLRIRARSQNASILDTTLLTVKRDSGNVGIGTTSAPGQKLEVAGALKLSTNPIVSNDQNGAYFWDQARVGPTIAGKYFEVRTGGDTPRLRIDAAGNVGLGTTIPVTKLHIAGSGNELPATSGTTQSAGHIARMRGSANASFDIGASNKGFWLQSTDLTNLAINNPLLLNPNGGNVGIGTTEATAKLHVIGSGSNPPATSATAQSAGHVARLKGSTVAILDIGASEKSFWLQSTDLTNLASNHSLLLNPNGGNVGIGTNTPKSLLHIRKDNLGGLGPTLTLMNGLGTPGAKVAIDLHTYWDTNRPEPSVRIVCEDSTRGSGHLIFQTKEVGAENMLERLRLDASGNVGIGTSDPKANLDVADTTKDTMKSILARLSEANPGTYLGVKAYNTEAKPWPADKSFALEHYFYSNLNSAINFHRGIKETGGYITVAVDQGTKQMTIDKTGLRVEGGIACGGLIGLKSAKWTDRYISARSSGEGWVVKTADRFDDFEQFTLLMACSREFKENISDLTALEAMTTLQHLTPVKYDYKGEKAFRQNLGFIAEDMPDNLASEDRKSISPFEVVPILTRVAKEQQRVIAKLQETVRALQENVRQIS